MGADPLQSRLMSLSKGGESLSAVREKVPGLWSTFGILAPGLPVRRFGLLLLSLGVAVYVQAKYGHFLTVSNSLTTLNNVATLAIASVGASALFIAGRVDLSIGGQLSLLSVLSALVGKKVGQLLPRIDCTDFKV